MDLINRLYSIVKLQYADVRRALHGQGNYELHVNMNKYKVSHALWSSKSTEEKDKLFKKFNNIKTSKKDQYIISTDKGLLIPKTPQTAKKSGKKKED